MEHDITIAPYFASFEFFSVFPAYLDRIVVSVASICFDLITSEPVLLVF